MREPARVVKSPLVEHWHRESELFVVVSEFVFSCMVDATGSRSCNAAGQASV